MHDKIVEEVKADLKDVVLRAPSYNKRYPSTRFDSYFIGVEDAGLFYYITVATETKFEKKQTTIRLDRDYNLKQEIFKERKK